MAAQEYWSKQSFAAVKEECTKRKYGWMGELSKLFDRSVSLLMLLSRICMSPDVIILFESPLRVLVLHIAKHVLDPDLRLNTTGGKEILVRRLVEAGATGPLAPPATTSTSSAPSSSSSYSSPAASSAMALLSGTHRSTIRLLSTFEA
jgi:hypothetical protein